MRVLIAEILVDGNLLTGVVVDIYPGGAVSIVGTMDELPYETANTVYFGGRLQVDGGYLHPDDYALLATMFPCG